MTKQHWPVEYNVPIPRKGKNFSKWAKDIEKMTVGASKLFEDRMEAHSFRVCCARSGWKMVLRKISSGRFRVWRLAIALIMLQGCVSINTHENRVFDTKISTMQRCIDILPENSEREKSILRLEMQRQITARIIKLAED